MDAFVNDLIGVAWLAVAGLLAWGVVHGLRKALADELPPPFFDLLDRQGLQLARVEESAGIRETARAVRRCTLCGKKARCRDELSCSAAFGSAGWPVGCPNAGMIEHTPR